MSDNKITKKSYINTETGKKIFYRISVLFLFVYIVLPQYFGLNTPGFDLTAQRMMIIFVFLYLMDNRKRAYDFYNFILRNKFFQFIFIYLFVCLYTALFRGHIGSFLYPFIEFLGMLIVAYIIFNSIGMENAFKLVIGCIYLLCIFGMDEYFMGRSPFSYLETIKGLYTGASVRSGAYRIMGPANHSLGYGLMLVVFLPLISFDFNKKKLYIFTRPVLLVLLILNVFFTGSRSTLAVIILEVLAIVIFSSRSEKKKTILGAILFLVIFAVVLMLTYKTSFGRYILLQITSVIDEVFDTTYSVNFGADINTLKNSSEYRSYLPKIFELSTFSPFIGRGSGYQFYWYVDGYLINSIDNFFVATYIRYGYPGMISYIVFIVYVVISLVRNIVKSKSEFMKCLLIGIVFYFVNLWYLDTLQTIKYVYLLFAFYLVSINSEGEVTTNTK